jgi:hypothetical protein
MPRKSTISHQGDIFDSLAKTRRRRNLNALHWHPSATSFFDFKFRKINILFNTKVIGDSYGLL